MWDERYAEDDYVYGTEPNSFLAGHSDKLQGPVLSIAEGEGRNAVFMAGKGFKVTAVDGSRVGLEKARALALENDVAIDCEVADLGEYEPAKGQYGTVVSIFAHLPGHIRSRLYPQIERSLKPGGILILEAYSLAQIDHDTGGPKDPDMLMSVDKIKAEFPGLEALLLQEIDRDVLEGKYHTGRASVVQFIGRKP